MAEGSSGKERIEIVHTLRGLAAVAVCWFHFTTVTSLNLGPFKQSGAYGWLGVEVFFVISGFILPYALYRSGYRLTPRAYGRFLAKRIVRLDPPYLASIAFILIAGYLPKLIPGHQGGDPIGIWQVLSHLGYLTGLLKYQWLNVVFWTLAIEFQFYLSIALLYPLISSRNATIRLSAQCLLAGLSLIPSSETLVLHYLFLFGIGITVFQARVGLSRREEWVSLLAIWGAGAAWWLGVPAALAGLGAAYAILAMTLQNRILHFLGNVSYSLYLIHVPVGMRIVRIAERSGGGVLYSLTFSILAMAASVGAAWLLYQFVEKPSQSYAANIRLLPEAAPVAAAAGLPEGPILGLGEG